LVFFRCFYTALSYLASFEWAKGLALLDRCESHVNVARSHHLDCEKRDEWAIVALDELTKRIQGERCLATAKAYLDTVKSPNPDEDDLNVSLADNLETYTYSFANSKSLANFPPEFNAVPCKPILFDLAHLALEFPNLESRKQKKSFFRSWWSPA
jgi:signal recognition particle subunit SRP68